MKQKECHKHSPQQDTKTSVAPSAIYTCPMHPEIRQTGPGACPICGMTLEPVDVSSKGEDSLELVDMKRRFWIAMVFSLPILFTPMSGWIQFILATPVVLWAGQPLLKRAILSVIHRTLNMFTLIGLGTSVAYLYSTAILFLAPGNSVYFEAAAVIMTLVLLGQVLELRARGQTAGAIRSLLGLAPKTARIIRADQTEEDIPIESVLAHDKIRVRPGEKIPVDGILIDGKTTINESMMTGESMPVIKNIKDTVIAGTVNERGSFVMEAQRVGSKTMLAQMVRLVSEAQRSRAPIQKLADQVSAYFVPAVILMSLLTFIGWIIFGPDPKLAHALINSVAVLIVACPCALGLATPMSIMVGIGKGAQLGVLIKNAEVLEVFDKINTLVVDKTGTLTEGKPRLVSLIAMPGFSELEILSLAVSLEKNSEHPLAHAIIAEGVTQVLPSHIVQYFEAVPGMGIKGLVESKEIRLGNSKLVGSSEQLARKASELETQGQSVMMMTIDGKPAGIIGVADPIKDTAREALSDLNRAGVQVIMLTGDNKTIAKTVAENLGINKFQAEVTPEQKNTLIRQLQSQGHIVAMAGDGINDAPALALAHVGIAMGTGTDIAMESAGVTLPGGDLRGIVRAKKLSRATMKNIRQNLFFAFIYNIVGVLFATGIFYPWFGILLSPILASAAMSFSSVSVIVNSLRLRMA